MQPLGQPTRNTLPSWTGTRFQTAGTARTGATCGVKHVRNMCNYTYV